MSGGVSSRGLLLAVPAAVLIFLLLAMADQHETFLSAIRPPVLGEKAAVDPVLRGRAEQTVRGLATATERSWAEGSATPLHLAGASNEMVEALDRELSHPVTREKGANSRCEELTVLDAHPATGGRWEVLTEERWSFAAGHSRLRFRYMLALEAGHFRPLTMTPMLPEPESEKTR